MENKIKRYKYIYKPTHPYANKKGYVAEHRLAMEKKLGRYLEPAEISHHRNGIKNDNRIENLELFKNNKVHVSFHFLKGGNKKKSKAEKIIIEVEEKLKNLFKVEVFKEGKTVKEVLTKLIEKYLKGKGGLK